MAEATRTLLRTVEGPNGRVEIYEVMQSSKNDATVGGDVIDYEIVFKNETQTTRALGEANLVAEELAGA